MTSAFWLLAGLFVCILTAVVAVGYILLVRPAASDKPTGAMSEPTLAGAAGMLVGTLRMVGEAIPAPQNKADRMRRRLIAAGYRSASAPAVFYGLKAASTFILAGLLAVVASNSDSNFSEALVRALCGAAFGYMMPDRLLEARIRQRRQRLRSGLPAGIDLLVLGLEADQSFDQALGGASKGLRLTHAGLAEELGLIQLELRASKSRADALRHFAARNREPELTKFANLLIDADRFGTSLGPALRTHAKYLRTRFKHEAQESARKVGVKLIFPVFFLIFPAVLLVTLGPAVIQLYAQLRVLTNAVP